jgi:PAS domain S-box-containing protein
MANEATARLTCGIFFIGAKKPMTNQIALEDARGIRRRDLLPLIAALVAGAICVWWLAARADHEMRKELLGQAHRMVRGVNIERVRALSGTEADLMSPVYLRLKEHLAAARAVNPKCRFIYLLGRKADGAIFFHVDSEPAGTEDESPAGQIYGDIPDTYRRVFDTRASAVEGPATDRWGSWVTALAPLNDPKTGELVAVLGMDIDARTWKWDVAAQVALPAGFVLMMLIVLASSQFGAKRFNLESQRSWIVQAMGLREKTALTLGGALVALIAVLYFGSRGIIEQGFTHLEMRDARKDVGRVLLTLAERQSTLESTVQDWACWDSAYSFAQDHNTAFIEENLTAEAMKTLRIQMLAIVDADGRLVWGGALNPEEPFELLTGNAFGHLYGDISFLSSTQGANGVRSGIVLRGEAPLLVAFAPILTSQKQGPERGIIVMGQVLDGNKVEQLAATLKMNLALFRADRLDDAPEQAGIVREISLGTAHAVRIVDEQTLTAYGLLSDLRGQPALLVQVSMTRDIHQEALRTTVFVAVLLAVTGVLVILSVLVLMRKLVLEKLERLSGNINRIARTEDFSNPISWEGTDELADVAHDVNLLLEAVTLSRRKLAASEAQLAATLRSIGDGVIACDRNGAVTCLNRTAEGLTGWTTAEAAGRPVDDVFNIVHAQTREIAQNPVSRAMKDGVIVDLVNHTALIAKDGSEHQIADSCAPIHDASGTIIGAVLVFRDVTEEYRRQEELRESEAFQRELLLNLPAGVVIVDPETRLIERVNEHAAALFGAPVDALIGNRCHTFLCPAQEHACPVCDMEQSVEHSERVMLCADGTLRPILKTVKRVRLNGRDKLLECFVDLSERKAAEERLRAFAQCLLEFSADTQANINRLVALCGNLLGGVCALYNRLDEGLLCSVGQWQTPPDFKAQDRPDGHLCYDVIRQSADVPLVVRDLQNSAYGASDPNVKAFGLQTYVGMAVKCRGQAVGSLCVVYQNDVQPIEDHLNFLRLAGFAMSVEEERRTQIRMQELLTRIAATYINLPLDRVDGAVQDSLGELGHFVGAERVYLFEYDFEREHCRNTHEWCAEGIAPQIQDLQEVPLSIIPHWVKTHRGGEAMHIPDVLALAPDNAVRQILEPQGVRSLLAMPLMDAGRCLGFVGFDFVRGLHVCAESEQRLLTVFAEMMASIRLRREMDESLRFHREKAEAANRAKSEFLANMSHEIRTPMNGVIGMTGLLLDTALSDEQRRFAETTMSSAESLLTLLNDILDFSKMEAGKLSLDYHDFSLRKILDEAVTPLALRAQEKGVEFICAAAPDVPDWLHGDPIRLRQILVNLAGNAVKFTERGEIEVSVERVQASEVHSQESGSVSENACLLRFSVNDTGIGIPADKQRLLFEKFSQVDASSTRRFGGTGLGLAIARQLTELMGGRIGMESKEGRGTTFWFTLSLERAAEKEPGSESVAAPVAATADIHGLRILVVDDNETNRQVLMTQLRAWGFRAREAADGPSALAVLREAREKGIFFRVAIMDMQMPGMDGVALAQVIQHEPAYAAMRLILLTSMGHTGESRRFKQAGFSAWLPKPVRASALFDVLHETLFVQAAQPAAEALASEVRTPVLSDASRILLVEDNEVNRLVAEGLLRKLNVRTDTVGNGADALAALERERYDLVLMDVQMPVMDGLEATRRIRASCRSLQAARHLPIVAMAAHAMQGDREKCLEAGMDDYIAKPISPKALADTLAKWLGTEGFPGRHTPADQGPVGLSGGR